MNKVYFVGAGPGDPELITIKAKKLIEEADVIVYSGSLLNPKILEYAKDAELYDASRLDREEINNILVEAALNGKQLICHIAPDPFFSEYKSCWQCTTPSRSVSRLLVKNA